jgi:hypothetical protein
MKFQLDGVDASQRRNCNRWLVADAAAQSLPTQQDVEKLTHDSDYSAIHGAGRG